MKKRLKIPKASEYRQHLKKYSQYTFSESWIKWGVHIIPYRGIRTAKILEDYVARDARVLDLGCGIGLSLHLVAQVFPNVVGCDIDDKVLEGSRKILKGVGIASPNLIKYDGKNLPFKSNSFDAVLSIEVIEHVTNPDVMLKEVRRVLKKDGILIITTPNKYWPLETHYRLPFLAYLPQKMADYYVKVTGKGQNYDVYPFSYNDFSAVVRRHFYFKDITLNIIRRYREFNLDKERGEKVKHIANFLKLSGKFNLNYIDKLITHLAAGWIFVARPRQ